MLGDYQARKCLNKDALPVDQQERVPTIPPVNPIRLYSLKIDNWDVCLQWGVCREQLGATQHRGKAPQMAVLHIF